MKNIAMENNNIMTDIKIMFKYLSLGKKETQPSKFWVEVNKMQIEELRLEGFDNFKQTLAKKYFSFIPILFLNSQVLFLVLNLNPIKTFINFFKSIIIPKHPYFNIIDSASYNFLTLMLWDYVEKNDDDNLLSKLEEPIIGNPPRIFNNNRLISQDLANSVIEYKSIMNEVINKKNLKIICELGAGSGRNAHVFLSLRPGIKYIIIDIPPALTISEKYLSMIFPKKKIFKFRWFKSFGQIKRDFEEADILFFLPNQIELLPSKIVDLFINISSFHEMRVDQIKYYFKQIERLAKKKSFFYFKEWKNSYIPFENVNISMLDYPICIKWNKIFMRTAKVQIKFFEAMLQLK